MVSGVKLGISLDPDRREGLFWRLQAFGWGGTLVTSVTMTSYLSLENGITLSIFRTVFAVVVSAFLLRPVFRTMRASRPVITPVRVVTIFALCVSLGIADTVSTLGLASVLGVNRVMEGLREVFIVSSLMRFALYAFWTVLYFGIHSLLDAQQEQLRAARTEAALRAGELQMLRSQVNPHFLFQLAQLPPRLLRRPAHRAAAHPRAHGLPAFSRSSSVATLSASAWSSPPCRVIFRWKRCASRKILSTPSRPAPAWLM